MQSADEEPESVLREEHQWCAPWGGSEDGADCDKCRGSGRTSYTCWSCALGGTERSCPACGGRVRWEDTCPVCRGTGKVDGKPRRGVSVFPKAEGLYHYLLATEANLVGLLVELEGEPAEDPDFDADQGAILVLPTAIERARPIEPEAIETIKVLGAER